MNIFLIDESPAIGVVFDAWENHPLTTTWPPQIDAHAKVRAFLKQHGDAS